MCEDLTSPLADESKNELNQEHKNLQGMEINPATVAVDQIRAKIFESVPRYPGWGDTSSKNLNDTGGSGWGG